MENSIAIRNPQSTEVAAVLDLVGNVMCETYGHLFAPCTPTPTDPEPWKHSWIAMIDNCIAGVVLATDDHIKDLWLLKQYRRRLVGSQLLARAESQILRAGYQAGKLRIIAENESAHRFYNARGWKDVVSYPHETWGFEMMNMEKRLSN